MRRSAAWRTRCAGDDRSGTVDVNLNLAKAVELALNDGRDMATGKQIGPRTGDPTTFATFEQFYARLQDATAPPAGMDDPRQRHGRRGPRALGAGALPERARGRLPGERQGQQRGRRALQLSDGGGRGAGDGGRQPGRGQEAGLRGAAGRDGPTARRALQANFEGHESLRQTLLNKAPKYGNDDAYADAIAREVSRFWTEEAFKHTSPTGKRYRGGYLSWNYWIAYAPTTAATPDGRRRGQFLSNAVCPVNGADRKGPTSVIKSVGKLGLESAPNGASHTMSFSPSLLRSPEAARES